MTSQNRRSFFKTVFAAGAAMAVSGTGALAGRAQAAQAPAIDGVCLYAPGLATARDFVEAMRKSAPGNWSVQPLSGSLTDCYFQAALLFDDARRGKTNTFVGVLDQASFAVVHEAILDRGGRFHYATHEGRDRVTFSAEV
ncbi:twin-arginine translocation pathway signal protein [Geoanaerobacter pelophilus]|uniref:Twin-arginine translocation pathway signal protein n=1 Tax=Geoanaerobacter pelophilus TaxID=60036 RepID=A0ABQ0MF03_9BACT|nr:twin-arginine translocation pathway signal protein [Geoanaerobacter pelophilus]GAW65352.1 twin-arginine translocation pathway signal protein [Geoanaerobacter pelophilus]